MNQTFTSFATSLIPRFFLLLLCTLFSFQQGNAQHHCSPSFHFTTNGNTVIFDDQSTADGNITGYEWDFGDGNTSTEQNPTHTYAAPGTYNVCLTITAHNPNCTATFCHHVVVTHPPPHECHAAFIAHQPDPTQPIIDFTDQTTADGVIVSWEWDFGDGNTSTDQNPTHTYAAPGAYLVCLTIMDDTGCTSHVCHHVVVHHAAPGVCHAEFGVLQPNPNHQTIHFTDLSTSDGIIGTWEWDFGDGNTSSEQNPTHTYSEPGTYLVCLTITDEDGGCTSHICHHVVVHHAPPSDCHAAFTYHVDAHGLGVQFNNTSTGTTLHTTYFWQFGDGTSSTEENPYHIFPHAGHYTVCLFIEDVTIGCSAHICYTINVQHSGHHHFHHPHHAGIKAVYAIKDETRTEQTQSPNVVLTIHPNPAVDFVQIVYQIRVAAKVKFEIYSLTGAKVAALPEGIQTAGEYTQVLSVANLMSGEYILKMTVDGALYSQQIVVKR
ncbi:MAG: PKD domain-containing protein [Saprospiraceae bacterium]|nr:PKD domain-containing protein [Saprospiraceae bacterium]